MDSSKDWTVRKATLVSVAVALLIGVATILVSVGQKVNDSGNLSQTGSWGFLADIGSGFKTIRNLIAPGVDLSKAIPGNVVIPYTAPEASSECNCPIADSKSHPTKPINSFVTDADALQDCFVTDPIKPVGLRGNGGSVGDTLTIRVENSADEAISILREGNPEVGEQGNLGLAFLNSSLDTYDAALSTPYERLFEQGLQTNPGKRASLTFGFRQISQGSVATIATVHAKLAFVYKIDNVFYLTHGSLNCPVPIRNS